MTEGEREKNPETQKIVGRQSHFFIILKKCIFDSRLIPTATSEDLEWRLSNLDA